MVVAIEVVGADECKEKTNKRPYRIRWTRACGCVACGRGWFVRMSVKNKKKEKAYSETRMVDTDRRADADGGWTRMVCQMRMDGVSDADGVDVDGINVDK